MRAPRVALAGWCVATLALALALGGCTTDVQQPPSPTAPGADVGTRLDAALPARILDLPFTTSDGRTITLRSFAGRLVAVSDAMTLCQETCPMDTATFVQTDRAEQRAGRGGDEVFLSITVDPRRDVPKQLAAYRRLYAPPPANWLALTGSQSTVDTLWNYLGVYRHRVPEPAGQIVRNWRTGVPLTYDVQHSDEVFFLDRRGHERFVLEGPPYAASQSVPATLQKFLNAQGRANLAAPAATNWTEAQARAVLDWLHTTTG